MNSMLNSKSTLRALILAGSIAALLAAPFAQAATYYWDVNGTAAGFSTVVGGWNGSNVFWNTDATGGAGGSTTAATLNTDDLNIVAATTNTGTIAVSGAQAANSITYGSTVGAVTISGGTSITLGNGTAGQGGITVNSGAGAQTISTAIALNNSQTWTNNSSNLFTTNGGVNLGANTLTFSGSGNISFGIVAASVISGTGSIVMNGTGLLTLGGAATVPVHTYSGGTTITNGAVMFSGNLPASGNLTLNGGVYQEYFGGTVSRALGSGSGQIQITGGTSGFSGQGATSTTFNIGGAAATLVWGSAFFNPSTFVLQAANAGVNTNGKMSLSNGINLSGSDRIIASNQTTDGAATSGATIAGVISNSTGAAGFEKTGVGNLILGNAANTFNGALTITGGWITAGASGSLGSGVATNTLIFNGGTLRATGTITSPATRGVTMTQTGIIDNNGQAISFAGNIGGAGGLTKNSTGTLTLSGTNSYGGVTTVNAGTLAITKEVALASNTAANLNVKSGAGLALNVDSTGTAGFTVANLDTLLGNILVASNAAQGLQAGATLSLDTGTASGATFTLGNAITNSTGASGGTINFAKLGANTLVLDEANTYTGTTTISAGTLQLNAGGVISTAPLLNNATFAVNSASAVTQGTNFGLIGGTGAVANASAGTLTLNLANTYTGTTTVTAGTLALANKLALQNSALTFSAASQLDLSGVTTPTIGGLNSSVNLALVTGYNSAVTALTLNPGTGITSTYSGIISNGAAANLTFTKTGAGTQTLTGANTYTGATIVNAGTLTLGAGGSLNSGSALQINGGTFSYGNTAAGQTLNGLAVGAGNSTVSNTASGQTLALGAITRTANIFGTVNFATLTGPISTTTGNANGIIGPWATTGSTTTLRYAVGSPDGSTPTNISALTGTTATANTLASVTSATTNYEYSAAVAGMGVGSSLTGNTLRYSGGATGTAIDSTSTLTLNGLMQAGTGTLTISGGPSTGGILIGSTGELVIAANAQATTISATIGGTGRLVYSGAGSTLSLSSLTNAYTGGTVINSGTVTLTGTANSDLNAILGNTSGGITLNGGQLRVAGANVSSAARIVTVNGTGSSIFVNKNNNFTTTGKLTGDGTLATLDGGGSGTLSVYSFNSTANDFTGRLTGTNTTINVNSFADSANSIALDGATFNYGTGAGSAASLPNRVIEMQGTTGGATITNSNTTATNSLSFGTDLLVTGVGNKSLTLGGANFGANTFSGKITDGPGSVISLGVNGANWIVSGNNTYTGQTTVSGSSGASLTLSGNNSGMTGNVVLSTATGTVASSPRLNINSATALGTGILNFGGGLATDVVRIDNTSAGAVNVSTANTITMNRNFTFVGTQDLSLGTGTTTLGGMTTGSSRSITVTAKTLTLNGTIAEAVANLGIAKAGAGTLLVSGTGNSYTGATTVSAGTLVGIGANAFGSTSGISIAAASTATLSLRGDSSTNFVKTSDSSVYSVTTTADGATINVDRATIAGTGAKTMTIGTLLLNTAITNGTNFTGANNTSLSIGAVTTGNSVSGTETLTNSITGGGSLTLASIAVNRTTTPTLAFAGDGDTTVTGNITQAATTILTKSGLGTLTLGGTGSHSGATTISGGSLTLGSGGATGSLSATASITNNANLTINHSNPFTQATDLNGKVIGGSGSFTQAGSGTTTLSLANTYAGTTTVSAGTLEVTVNNALGTNAAGTSVTGGATLLLNNVNYGTTEALTINGAGVGGTAGALASNGTSTFAGAIAAATSAVINATGPLALTGGVVKDGTTLTFMGGGVITISGVGISGASANSDLVVDGATVMETVANTYNGPTTITNGGALNANVVDALPFSPRSVVSLTGTGAPTLNLGASQVAASLSSSTTSAVVNLSATGTNTLTVGAAGGSTTYTGSISGSGGNLVKDGVSTQILTGTNTFTGTTTVGTTAAGAANIVSPTANGGTLVAGAVDALKNTSGIAVNNGGTLLLAGAGTLNRVNDSAGVTLGTTGGTGVGGTIALSGTASEGSGAIVTGGTPAGTNVDGFGSLTLSSNSTLNFDSLSNGTMVFAGFNPGAFSLNVSGYSNSTFDGSLNSGTANDDRLIFHVVGGLNPSQLGSIDFGSGVSAGQIDLGGDYFEVGIIAPIPEPTTVLSAFALLGLVGYRERRLLRGLWARA